MAPIPNPVTVDVSETGLVIVPVPLIKVHTPVPTIGRFAAKAAVFEHIV